MGVMAVYVLLRWRLFRFVFGGGDAHVSLEELLVMRLYEALLAKAIWTSRTLPFHMRILLLLTLDDDDLQHLIIEEHHVDKAGKLGPLWRALTKHSAFCGDRTQRGSFQSWTHVAVV